MYLGIWKKLKYKIFILSKNKMKYKIKINEIIYDIDIKKKNEDIVLLFINNKSYEFILNKEINKTFFDTELSVFVNNIKYQINIYEKGLLKKNKNEEEDKLSITAPMPGKIIRFLLKKGEKVKKGEGIMVLEAMKMENELKASSDGYIDEIKYDVGALVLMGDELIKIKK